MRHQSQKGFRGIFFAIPQYQKRISYLRTYYTLNSFFTWRCIWQKGLVLAYTSHPYSEALATRPSVSCIPYATLSHEQTGNIITFTEFEEGNFLKNERNIAVDESNCTCWHKVIKYASSVTKGFSGYLLCNSTISKKDILSTYLLHIK